ncbi:hypothetical protein EON82_17795 [bacterium]|nr:MAG: hypothetical protein EON82_17795 [bacterium]
MDAKSLDQAAKATYWQDKDLSGARKLLEEGIALAREQGLKGEEKAMSYDLAAFCWTGWDEPGVVITAGDEAAGLRAAEENLRLAQELERPSGPMGNAWWMVGAYRFQEGDFAGATKAFEEFRRLAEGDSTRVLLADGYVEIARMFTDQTSEYRRICEELRSLEGDGSEYATQLETAVGVFIRRWMVESERRRVD